VTRRSPGDDSRAPSKQQATDATSTSTIPRLSAEARNAAWEFNVLVGIEDVLLEFTDPARDDLGADWHEFGWTIARRDYEGRLLAEVGAS
jgi:hypothetical protein